MNDNLQQLIIIAALALYNNKRKGGLVEALAYLTKNGYEINEAIDVIATFDRYEDAIKTGDFPDNV